MNASWAANSYDEAAPRRVRATTVRRRDHGHDVRTVRQMRWDSVRDGRLLPTAAEQFDALVTVDQGIEHQQNPATLPITIIVLHARSNRLEALQLLVPGLLGVLKDLPPKRVVHVYT